MCVAGMGICARELCRCDGGKEWAGLPGHVARERIPSGKTDLRRPSIPPGELPVHLPVRLQFSLPQVPFRVFQQEGGGGKEMVQAYEAVKTKGLRNVRMGNIGIFANSKEQVQIRLERVGFGSS